MKPCLVPGCPQPAHRAGPRCQIHERIHQAERNHRRPQYRGGWSATSRRARDAEPWCHCTGCRNCTVYPNLQNRDGTFCMAPPKDLTLDHEFSRVECRSCNSGHRHNIERWQP